MKIRTANGNRPENVQNKRNKLSDVRQHAGIIAGNVQQHDRMRKGDRA